MWRTMRIAAYTLAVTLVLSGFVLARDDDDDNGYYRQGNPAQARQYGYQNGYRDGMSQGRHEGQEHDPYDYQTPDWRQATRGFQNWMGPVNWYQRGYQDGYSNGFRYGFQSVSRGSGDNDGDDRSYGNWRRSGYDPNWGAYGGNAGYQFGYQDGSQVAREDIQKGKPYNPNPRGKYDDCDRGYRREFGSKDQYKAQYANGYRAGYQSVMGNRY